MFTRVTVTLKVCSTASRTVYLVAAGKTSKVYWPKLEESLAGLLRQAHVFEYFVGANHD